MTAICLLFVFLLWQAVLEPLVIAQTYSYNPGGRITSVTYAGGAQVKYTYDAAGNISAIATNSVIQATNSSVLTISTPMLTGNGSANTPYTFSFSWSSQPGSNYEVQFTTDLTSGNWNVLGSPINATNSTITASDFITTNQQRFYRIVLLH